MQRAETLLTTHDVSRILRVSQSTLSKWRVSKREVLRFLKLGRAVRYRLADVEAYLSTRLRSSTSDAGSVAVIEGQR